MHPHSGRYPPGQPNTNLAGDGVLPNELAVTQLDDHFSDRIAVNRMAAVKPKKVTSPGPTQNWTRNCTANRYTHPPFVYWTCTGCGVYRE